MLRTCLAMLRKGEVAIDDESVIVSRRDVSSLYSSLSLALVAGECVRTYDAEGERPFIILKAPALISPVALQPSNQSTKATRNNPPHLATRPALDGNTLTHYTHSRIDNVTLLLEIVLIHLFASALTCSNLIPLLTEPLLFCAD